MQMRLSSLRKLPRPVMALMVVEGVLKATAAWKALRNGQRGWAVALIVLNTAGILPILYLVRFQKK